MQVLVLDDDCQRQFDLSVALMQKGFQTSCAAGTRVAESFIRSGAVDLLIMPERVAGRLTHALALLAEYRNPLAATLMLTDRTDADIDELYLLLPSLHGLVATDAEPELIARLAVASVSGAAAGAGTTGEDAAEQDAAAGDEAEPLMLSRAMRVTERARAGDLPVPIFATARGQRAAPMAALGSAA